MDFLEALSEAVDVICDNQDDTISEVYLHEPTSKAKVYLKDCEGGLSIDREEPLLGQLYAVLERENGIRINELFCEWEVCIWKQCFSKITRKGYSDV